MLPNLFFDPPSPLALEAKAKSPLDPERPGIAAALVIAKGGETLTLYAFTIRPDSPKEWGQATPDELWSPAALGDIRALWLTGPRGTSSRLSEIFEPFWEKKAENLDPVSFQVRRGLWQGVFMRAATDPLAKAIELRNRRYPGWKIKAAIRWQIGAPVPVRATQPGAVIAPPLAHAPVLEWLLGKNAMAAQRPLCEAPLPVPVLYEDEALLACVKPAGLPSVPGTLERYSAKAEFEKTRGVLFTVHRLDQGTSGILLFAKTPEAAAALGESFRKGEPEKRYRARLEGTPKERTGSIALPLAPDPEDRPRQVVIPKASGGKAALTCYEVVSVDEKGRALVDLFPRDGRTHQLRVHCAHASGLGTPIEGDPLYGSEGQTLLRSGKRLCLHMAEITLPHPVTGKPLHLVAEAEFD